MVIDKAWCFVKFTTEEYAEKLLNGEVFTNRKSYFAEISDPDKRDEFEGYNFFYRSYIPDIAIDKQVIDTSNIYEFKGNSGGRGSDPHIFCMSVLHEGMREFSDGKIFSENLRKYGDMMIIIYNITEFYARLWTSLEKYEGLYAEGSSVNYFDPDKHNGNLDWFAKQNKYEYEDEWRLVLDVPKEYLLDNQVLGGKDPFVFNIGSIRDIAKKIKTDEFINKYDSVNNVLTFS